MTKGEEPNSKIVFGDFTIDVDRSELSRLGTPVRLQSQPMRLLALLAQHLGETVSHEEIYQHLWGPQIVDHSGGLHVCVRQIRAALGDDGNNPTYIQNVPRRGYRLLNPETTSNASIDPPQNGSRPRRRLIVGSSLAASLMMIALASWMWESSIDGDHNDDAHANSQAIDAYLRGRFLLERADTDSVIRSREFFARSIQMDRDFAPAYSSMAEAYQLVGDLENTQTYAATALALDPDLADGHLRMGAAAFFGEWDWDAAEQRFKTALQLDPKLAEAHHAMATVLSVTGRFDQALRHMETALSLDPASTLLNADYGYFLYYSGDCESAVEQCRQAMELDPSNPSPVLCVLKAAMQTGNSEVAVSHALKYIELSDDQRPIRETLKAQPPQDALRTFAEWRLEKALLSVEDEKAIDAPAALALLHVNAGLHAEGLRLLRVAQKSKDALLPVILLDPEFSPLHNDEEFRRVVSQMNISVRSIAAH